MPVVSRFFGIVVFFHWREHAPPHFHANYQDQEVTLDIATGTVTGHMNARALSMLQEWRRLRQTELLENWRLAEERRPLRRIEPLE